MSCISACPRSLTISAWTPWILRSRYRLLSDLHYLFVKLFSGLLDEFLDTARMDPAVLDKLVQGEPRDFAPDRIESGEDDRFGSIVDDHIDAGGVLESPDIPALAADDPSLHLVVGKVDDRYGRFDDMVGSAPFDGQGDDLPADL